MKPLMILCLCLFSLSAFAERRERGNGGGVGGGGISDYQQVTSMNPELTECEVIRTLIEMNSTELHFEELYLAIKRCNLEDEVSQ